MESKDDSEAGFEAHREAVLKRWLGMEVERATLDDLAEVSLAERLEALESMFDAAVEEMRITAPEREPTPRAALDAAIAEDAGSGRPVTLVIFDAPRAGPDARGALATSLEDGASVLDCGEGRVAAILPNIGPATAPAVVDRVRVRLWDVSGASAERVPDAGSASYPQDGRSADELISLAIERLCASHETDWSDVPPPASVTPLHRPIAGEAAPEPAPVPPAI